MTDGTTDVPKAVLGEYAREMALCDGEVRVHAPEGADVDKWAIIKEAKLEDTRWEDGDLHVWFETETRIQERVARATHRQPAEYRNHYVDTFVTIVWDLDVESDVHVDIEVMHP
jgi:hypothetical protein